MKNNNIELNIHNPTSAYPILYVAEKNSIVNVHLSGDYAKEVVAFDDKFIKLQKTLTEDKSKIYKFKIHQEPFAYNAYSNVFIGDIDVGKTSSILLLAKPTEEAYKDYVTVLSPISNVIRLKPYQTLEIIYFNTTEFDSSWIRASDITMHEVKPEKKMLDLKNLAVKHFSFTDNIYYKCITNQKSVYAGRLEFSFGNKSVSNFLNVYVDLNDKYKRRLSNKSIKETKPLVVNTITTDPDVLLTRDVVFEKVVYENLSDGCEISTGDKKDENTKGKVNN